MVEEGLGKVDGSGLLCQEGFADSQDWEDGAVVVGRGEDWAVWRLLIGRRRQWLGKRTSRGAWAEDNILAGLGPK